MNWTIIIIVIACLLVGAGGGYGTGYMKYEPKIEMFEAQVSDLTTEVSSLVNNVSVLEKDIAEKGVLITAQQSQLSSLKSEKSMLQGELNNANTQIQAYKAQTDALKSEVSALDLEIETLHSGLAKSLAKLAVAESQYQSIMEQVDALRSEYDTLYTRMENIMGTTVTQAYNWTYQWTSWNWQLKIPLSLYFEYSERPRPSSASYFVEMARDPNDDFYINYMAQEINAAALGKGYTDLQKVNLTIAFVQNLPYTVDIETTPYDEYPRYPIETLFDRGGDCEDTSILVAALLDRLGYDVALLLLHNARHAAVGVQIPGASGSYYNYDGEDYYYLETTGDGWQIGQIPPDITDTSAAIYPL